MFRSVWQTAAPSHMIVIMLSVISLFDQGRAYHVEADGAVFRAGAPVRSVFLVREGRAALVRSLPSGDQAILQNAGGGDILAEASVYADQYHCDCIALATTRISALPVAAFKQALREDPTRAESWAAHLARTVQRARMRTEIRSLKTVAARLDTWLAENGALPAKGNWQMLADELSVSREALYRELAKRRRARARDA